MAFNFNWSPLTADSSFYSRAQELLTAALNKSPKPPIIVDDIIVNELNLGSVPPELEILEVGDLAEDRFRGIFKMTYTGDAFLTLRTRVQANPLNTYLSTTPSFTSPQPLAASSGLTIPLQITLSDIKLSAFIILVFSKQKGLTLVFRNDPLESLKVSSTFDSIPFVRDYLQKTIETQLRNLLMEDVPAIIHRLSLRLWVPEYRARDDAEQSQRADMPIPVEKHVDPFSSPPHDPVDSMGNPLDAAEISLLSLESGGSDTQSLFSQRSLLRLAALTDSHRTLSLFTPSIPDAIYRAWAGPSERGEPPGVRSLFLPFSPGLRRTYSYAGSVKSTTSHSELSLDGSSAARPGLLSVASSASTLSSGGYRQPRAGKKRKTRVINLRRTKSVESLTTQTEGSTPSAPQSVVSADPAPGASIEREPELMTPPGSPRDKTGYHNSPGSIDLGSPQKRQAQTPKRTPVIPARFVTEGTQTSPERIPTMGPLGESSSSASIPERPRLVRPTPDLQHLRSYSRNKRWSNSSSLSSFDLQNVNASSSTLEPPPGGILERAWIIKLAGEIARRAQEEKSSDGQFWQTREPDELPPPAYGA